MVMPFPVETVVCFCPACGRKGEYDRFDQDHIHCFRCGAVSDTPPEVELATLDPEPYPDE